MEEISFAVIATTVSVDRGVPAARLPDRPDRPALPRVRRHGRGVGRASRASSRSRCRPCCAPACCGRHAAEHGIKRAARARLRRARRTATARAARPALRHGRVLLSWSASLWVAARRSVLLADRRRASSSRPPTAATILDLHRAPEGSTIDVHRPLPAAGRGHRARDAGGRPKGFSVVALGNGTPRRRQRGRDVRHPDAVGGARRAAAGRSSAGSSRAAPRSPGMLAFPIEPAGARPELRRGARSRW